MEATVADRSGDGGPAPFLLKTYDMVDDSLTDEIVSWSSANANFVVWNLLEFSAKLLPTYFKHNNFSTFIRQLSTYVREYIDDTEDYVNIQLDNQRNELIQLQLLLTIASFAIAINTLIVGIFAMNIPCPWYDVHYIFWPFVAGTSSGCFIIFLLVLGYARWKKLLGP